MCANTGFPLHLIAPLGFELDEPRLRRAGLDYHEWATVTLHENITAYVEARQPKRILAFSAHASHRYSDVSYELGDALLFGPETRGLPNAQALGVQPDYWLTIPMRPDARSLNLSNAVAVCAYEAWRQHDFQ